MQTRKHAILHLDLRRSLVSTALMSTALVTVLSSATARGQGSAALLAPSLPSYRKVEVATKFGEGKVLEALRASLNSPGDKLTLQLGASIGGAAVAFFNVSQAQKLEVEVRRTDTGYEAALRHEDARKCGFEVYGGLEINAGLGTDKKVVFAFSSDTIAASRLEAMYMASIIDVAARLPGARGVLTAYEYLEKGARSAVDNAVKTFVGAQQRLQQVLLDLPRFEMAFHRAASALSGARSTYLKGRAAYLDARSAFDAARKALDDSPLPDFLKGALHDLLSAARSALDDAYRVYVRGLDAFRAADRALIAARDAYQALENERLALVRDLPTFELNLTRASSALGKATSDTKIARDAYNAISYPYDILARHLEAVEFQVHRSVDIAATLTVPGVNLSNLGAGFQGASKTGARIRLEKPLGPTQRRIVVSAIAELATTSKAGLFVGVEGSSKLQFGVHASFFQTHAVRGVPHFAYERTIVDLSAELQAVASVGIGWSARSGVGRRIQVQLPEQVWTSLVKNATSFASDPSLTTLANIVRGVRFPVTITDHWLSGAGVDLGGSIAGYELTLGGSVVWTDEGAARTLVVDLGTLLDEVTNATTLTPALSQLAALRR